MKRILQRWRHRLTMLLTLRWRLTLWTAGLLLVVGVSLLGFVNMLMAVRVPRAVEVVLLSPTLLQSSPLPTSVAGGTTPAPMGTEAIPLEYVEEIPLRELRFISLLGVGIFTVAGGLGAYWMARQALRPVHHLSHLAREVQADTLHQRLAIERPPDEVKELADALDHMLARLERAFEQQSRFVADAAHELRTPLATLRANLEVLQRDPHATVGDYRQMGATLERALNRLEALVTGLLLLAKGEKEIEVAPVYLETLLGEVLQELEPVAQAHGVSLRLNIDGEIVLAVDGPLLARATSNLVENGIRYNRPGGSVTVTAGYDGNEVIITVEDTGIGIAPEHQAHIFERFYRVARSRSRREGGAGLGLSIVAHIVQLHGGSVRVESTPGVGSRFTLRLPVRLGL